jgi:hypothetical protein
MPGGQDVRLAPFDPSCTGWKLLARIGRRGMEEVQGGPKLRRVPEPAAVPDALMIRGDMEAAMAADMSAYGVDGETRPLEGDQCLVFFLGGIPNRAQDGYLLTSVQHTARDTSYGDGSAGVHLSADYDLFV